MSNLLVLSVGRRTTLVGYLRTAMNSIGGEVVCADCDPLAPALYRGDKRYLVPPYSRGDYMDAVMGICAAQDITGVLSLTDPELTLLSQHEPELSRAGIKLFHPPNWSCELALDKLRMAHFLQANGFYAARTSVLNEMSLERVQTGQDKLPLVVKPRFGSASLGVHIIRNLDELDFYAKTARNDEMIAQEYLEGDEYGIDCYVDYYSGVPVSLFIKRKIRMRSGETEKSISVREPELAIVVQRLLGMLAIRGAADIDAFKVDGQWYVSEVNPRFGGGYPHAFEAGCDFPSLIAQNVTGLGNVPKPPAYEEGTVMMKNDGVLVLTKNEVLSP